MILLLASLNGASLALAQNADAILGSWERVTVSEQGRQGLVTTTYYDDGTFSTKLELNDGRFNRTFNSGGMWRAQVMSATTIAVRREVNGEASIEVFTIVDNDTLVSVSTNEVLRRIPTIPKPAPIGGGPEA